MASNEIRQLRKPQVAILRCLYHSKRELNRKEVSQVSGVDESKIGDYAGPRPFNQSAKTRNRWKFPALDSLGFVIAEQHDLGGDKFLYKITDKGREFWETRYAESEEKGT